jgi:outer membrane protein OmpA-like peptidoglycan-associated protein
MDEKNTPDSADDLEPAAPAATAPTSPNAPTASTVSTPLIVIGFIIMTLLSVLIFQGIMPGSSSGASEDSPAIRAIQADIKSRQGEVNRLRSQLGMEPLAGGQGAESAEDVAKRLKADADTLASLAASFQELLARKDAQLDEVRAESVAALKDQNRLRELLDTTNRDLRKALVDASLATTLQSDLEKAQARMALLEKELLNAHSVPEDLQRRLAETEQANTQLKARIAELETELNNATIFASSEDQILREAVALYRALQNLEGKADSEIATSYSQFGANLGANVMKTCTFATGSSDIAPDLEAGILPIPAEAPENAMIFVVGYASETGNVDNNRRLSSDRATRVAELIDTVKRPGQKVQAAYLGQTDRFSSRIAERNQIVEIWQIVPKKR